MRSAVFLIGIFSTALTAGAAPITYVFEAEVDFLLTERFDNQTLTLSAQANPNDIAFTPQQTDPRTGRIRSPNRYAVSPATVGRFQLGDLLDTDRGTYGVSSTFFDDRGTTGGAVGVTAAGLPGLNASFLNLSVPQQDLSLNGFYDLAAPVTLNTELSRLEKPRGEFSLLLDDGRQAVIANPQGTQIERFYDLGKASFATEALDTDVLEYSVSTDVTVFAFESRRETVTLTIEADTDDVEFNPQSDPDRFGRFDPNFFSVLGSATLSIGTLTTIDLGSGFVSSALANGETVGTISGFGDFGADFLFTLTDQPIDLESLYDLSDNSSLIGSGEFSVGLGFTQKISDTLTLSLSQPKTLRGSRERVSVDQIRFSATTAATVPLPGTMTMMGFGIAALFAMRRRSLHQQV